MTGGNGDASLSALLHAETGLISGSSAVLGRAEPALAGGSSTATAGSPPPPSKRLKGRKAEEESSKIKRKKVASKECDNCRRQFNSYQARNAHMRRHKGEPQGRDDPPKQQVHEEQVEECLRTTVGLQQGTMNTMEGRETKGNSSAVAEGGISLPAAEVERKLIHQKFHLNKDAPEDTAVAEGGTSLSAAQVQRKLIHQKLDLNKDAPEDDENDDEDGCGDREGP